MKKKFFTCVNFVLLGLGTCFAQPVDTLWEKLSPWFNPPAQYHGNFGNFRNPLLFYDGRVVKSPQDWPARRKEIQDRWHSMMGQWPPLVDHPSSEILSSMRRENFIQYSILFSWRPDETTEGYLLVPDGTGKRPAVISVFYEPESAIGLKRPNLDFAYQLAKRGFVTLSIGTNYIASGKPFAQYYPNYEHATIQPLSMLAYLAANAWNLLADRPEVDPARIGIVGLSYGSKWAMFASCLYEKYACAVWSDGGIVFDNKRPNINYWSPWYLGYYPPPWAENSFDLDSGKGLYPELIKNGYDLTDLHALMSPRPFLVSGGSEDGADRWIPLNQSIRVNQWLGYKNRIGMTNRPGHLPDPGSNETVWRFFEYFLKPDGLRK